MVNPGSQGKMAVKTERERGGQAGYAGTDESQTILGGFYSSKR